MSKMKGITCCGDCGHYDWKKHTCSIRKGTEKTKESFFSDCPLPNVQEVKQGKWILKDDKGNGVCSVCNKQDKIDPLATHCRYCGSTIV